MRQVNGSYRLAVTGSALGLLICGDLAERFNSFGRLYDFSNGPLLVVLIVYFSFPNLQTKNSKISTLMTTNDLSNHLITNPAIVLLSLGS